MYTYAIDYIILRQLSGYHRLPWQKTARYGNAAHECMHTTAQ